MCGLVGYILTENGIHSSDVDKHQRFFRKALFLDTLRGEDSTGIVNIGESFHHEIFKKSMAAPDFLDTKYMRTLFNKSFSYAMLGHNRAATKGAVNADNAHPFEHGHITLMHNGTLNSLSGLGGKFDVDSEHIAYTISKAQKDADVVKVLEALDGAFALVWYNSKDDTVNLARNDERTLYIQATDVGLLYASEPWIIEGGVSEQFKAEINRKGPINPLPTGQWLRVNVLTGATDTVPFTPAPDWYGRYSYSNTGTSGGTSVNGNKKNNVITIHTNGNKASDTDASKNIESAEAHLWRCLRLTAKDDVLVEVFDYGLGDKQTTVAGKLVTCSDYELPSPASEIQCRISGYTRDERAAAKDKGLKYMVVNIGGAFYSGSVAEENLRVWAAESKFAYTEEQFKDGAAIHYTDDQIMVNYCQGVYDDEEEEVLDGPPDDKPDEPTYYYFDGTSMSREEMNEFCKAGCAWCNHPIDIDAEEFEWTDELLFHKKCVGPYINDMGDE